MAEVTREMEEQDLEAEELRNEFGIGEQEEEEEEVKDLVEPKSAVIPAEPRSANLWANEPRTAMI